MLSHVRPTQYGRKLKSNRILIEMESVARRSIRHPMFIALLNSVQSPRSDKNVALSRSRMRAALNPRSEMIVINLALTIARHPSAEISLGRFSRSDSLRLMKSYVSSTDKSAKMKENVVNRKYTLSLHDALPM